MRSFLYALRAKSCTLLIVVLILALAACNDAGSTGKSTPSDSSPTITIGGKLDTEAQLLTKLYALLLKHAGFKVVERAALGAGDVVFNALNSGQIDLYPEFTATGLAKLGLYSTGRVQQDYLQVKQGYEAKYHITWLDASPLNNTYGLCTTRTRAGSLGLTKISDLAGKASRLTIAIPPDGVKRGVDVIKAAYGFTFKKIVMYNEENQAFSAITSNTQDLSVCSTTSAAIAKYNLVLLRDDKNAFPVYNPAPIIRDSVLRKEPRIAVVLNELAPLLTTQVSQQLQAQVVAGESITVVATRFLHNKGLL